MNNECPYCHGDRQKDNKKVMRLLCLKHHMVSNVLNAGGRFLEFKDKGRLHLPVQCNQCDETRLRIFLGELSENG